MNDRSEGIKDLLKKLEISSPALRAQKLIRFWKIL